MADDTLQRNSGNKIRIFPIWGELLATKRPIAACLAEGIKDSAQHLLICCKMGEVPRASGKIITSLVTPAMSACAPNLGLPILYRAPTALGIELDQDLDSEKEGE